MPRIPEVHSQEKLPTSALQQEAGLGAAGVEYRALAEGAVKVGASIVDLIGTLKKNQDAADALDAMGVLTNAETQAADANNELARSPDYRTHVQRAEAAWGQIHGDALAKMDNFGTAPRLHAIQQLEAQKANFLVKARIKQQEMFKDEYRAKLGVEADWLKKNAMTTDDPGVLAASLTKLSGLYDLGVSGGLMSQQEREAKQEKDLNQVYTLRGQAALDANPDQFLEEVHAGSWRFIDPVVLQRMTERASNESHRRRTEAHTDAQREEKRVEDGMKAARQRVVSEGTGAYLDLQKNNAGIAEYQSALKQFESEANIFGVDKSTDDYRRVHEALNRPFFNGGVDDPHVVNQVKLMIRMNQMTDETNILEYRGRGISDKTAPELIDLFRKQKTEGDISTMPQFKEGRDRIMIRIGRGAFSLPGMGGMFNPQDAVKLEQALDRYTQQSRGLYSKLGPDALGKLHDLATAIILEIEGDNPSSVTPTKPAPAKPGAPAKPKGPSSGINRYTPPDLQQPPK